MAFPYYLAMTAAELGSCEALPQSVAWMACHFSSYGTGLSNLPEAIAPGSMLILNDRIPPQGHDPEVILRELQQLCEAFAPSYILLDFQRRENRECAALSALLPEALPCPVIVSEAFSTELQCDIFLPPVPPECLLSDYLAPWEGKNIWLEAALGSCEITLTAEAYHCAAAQPLPPEELRFSDAALFCHYRTSIFPDSAVFHLQRTHGDLMALLSAAEAYGVTGAVGLYQELGNS